MIFKRNTALYFHFYSRNSFIQFNYFVYYKIHVFLTISLLIDFAITKKISQNIMSVQPIQSREKSVCSDDIYSWKIAFVTTLQNRTTRAFEIIGCQVEIPCLEVAHDSISKE